MPCYKNNLKRPQGLFISYAEVIMVLEIVMWGFFSAWGWFGASYVKDYIWPPAVPVSEQKLTKSTNE